MDLTRLALVLVILANGLAGCAAPGAPAAALPHCARAVLVGLVTDAAGLQPGSPNAEAWAGVQRAAADPRTCIRASVLESKQAADYSGNLGSLAGLHYDLVIASSPDLSAAAAAAAGTNPGTRFALLGLAVDGGSPNLTGLTFQPEQAALLAGAVAGIYTRSNAVGAVYGPVEPRVAAYRRAFEKGARYVNPAARIYGVYQPPGPDFEGAPFGRARAEELITQGADVVFSGGRAPGSGELEATAARGRACIGFGSDAYLTVEAARPCLLTSAVLGYSAATEAAARMAAARTLKGGNLRFDAGNGGVALAPFHQFESRVGPDLRRRIKEFQRLLASGVVQA